MKESTVWESVQVLNSASSQIPLQADSSAWRVSVGLFHRIKETEGWSGGHPVQPPMQNGPAMFPVILLNP